MEQEVMEGESCNHPKSGGPHGRRSVQARSADHLRGWQEQVRGCRGSKRSNRHVRLLCWLDGTERWLREANASWCPRRDFEERSPTLRSVGCHFAVQLSTRPGRGNDLISSHHRKYCRVSSDERRTFLGAQTLRDAYQRRSTTWGTELSDWSRRVLRRRDHFEPGRCRHCFHRLERCWHEALPRFCE